MLRHYCTKTLYIYIYIYVYIYIQIQIQIYIYSNHGAKYYIFKCKILLTHVFINLFYFTIYIYMSYPILCQIFIYFIFLFFWSFFFSLSLPLLFSLSFLYHFFFFLLFWQRYMSGVISSALLLDGLRALHAQELLSKFASNTLQVEADLLTFVLSGIIRKS